MEYMTLPVAASPYYTGYGGHLCINPCACKLKVDGQGTIKVKPDVAEVNVGVITEDKQLELAQRENALRINAIINALKGLGIPNKDIQTLSYVIDPQYDFVDGKQVFRGYRVLHSLRILVRDMNSIGRVVDKAVESGANQVSGIAFSIEDPSKYYQRALEAAIDDAIAKSTTIGKKLNIVLSKVPVQIVEESYEAKPPVSPVLLHAVDTATQIQSGQIEVNARIEAIFTYTPRHGQKVNNFMM